MYTEGPRTEQPRGRGIPLRTAKTPAIKAGAGGDECSLSVRNVEPEVGDLLVFHDVTLTLYPQEPLLLGNLEGVVGFAEVIQRDDFRCDESAGDIRVDLACSTPSTGAGLDDPGLALVFSRRVEGLELEQLICSCLLYTSPSPRD